jgi:hypothetical protein
MATAVEGFDQVVVGGAARSSEVMAFFCFYIFSLLDGSDGIRLSQQKHLCGIFSMYI